MKLHKLIKKLQDIEKKILDNGGSAMKSEVMIETYDDNLGGGSYYENSFDLYVDDNNDIGLSP